jgi:uncharacterized Zn-binding protein involved in type VI secretion
MPPVVRLGDVCTGHGCWPSRPNVQGCGSVFANGIPVHCVGHGWALHCFMCGARECHAAVLASGSPNVFAEGRAVGRIGDAVSCGSACASGSPNVICN